MNVREWALPVYTILMQLAIGALTVLWILRSVSGYKLNVRKVDTIIRNPILVIVFTAAVAMLAAHFHLSKPYLSFLAVSNFKTSWLSREIVFSILLFLAMVVLLYLTFFKPVHRVWITLLGWFAILVGLVLVYCMAQIYILPTQVAWNSPWVIVSFYVTSLMLGSNAMACLMLLDLKFAEINKGEDIDTRVQVIKSALAGLTLLTIILVVFSILIIYYQMYLLNQEGVIGVTSVQLLLNLYLPLFILRQVFLVIASAILSVATYRMYRHQTTPQNLIQPVYISCLLIIIGEIIGRFLFYATHIRIGL